MYCRRKSPPYLQSQDFWFFHNRFRKFVFDFSLYYLFGQKFWFWQTFWKVVFAIFIRTRCGRIFCPSLIYLDRNSIPTNFFEKFLRSPQLHSQKNRAFVNRIPKYSLFIYILKLSPPNVFFFAYRVAIFTPSPNSHRKSKNHPPFWENQ